MERITVEAMLKKFHGEIGMEKLQWLVEHFDGSKTVKEMFEFLLNFELEHKFITFNFISSEKSHEEALNLQQKGDEYFDEGNNSEALKYYTYCIMHAPHPLISCERAKEDSDKSNERYTALSTGYAKRSAVLFKLGYTEHCLTDINSALSYGFSDCLGDLDDRRAQCITQQNNNTNKLSRDFDTLSILPNRSAIETSQKFPRVKEPHSTFPSLSSCLKVVYSPDKGRHIVAERDIDPGEILGVERSPCCSLDLGNLSTHCSTCLVKSPAPIPCPDCSMVVFCSEECRAEALSYEHWLECRLLPSLVSLGMHPVFTPIIKALDRYSCKQLRAVIDDINEDKKNSQFRITDNQEENTSKSQVLRVIDHLVTNKEARPRGDLYIKCFLSLILTRLLEQSQRFFVDSFGKSVTPTHDDLLFTGEIVFNNLMKTSCNGFKLLEIKHCNEGMHKVDIGCGVYPTLCLFNHSCHPNCEPYNFGRTQVVRASRPISSGSEVTEGYIRGFYTKPKHTRQKNLLDTYQFTCECQACKENWPTYEDLPRALQFECIDCHNPISDSEPICMSCYLDYSGSDHEPNEKLLIDEWIRNTRRVKTSYEKSQKIAAKMMQEKTTSEDDLSEICQTLILMEKFVPFPCRPQWDVHDAFDLYFHLQREEITLEQLDCLK